MMPTNHTPTQQYKIIQTEKDFEIRFYPSVVMATITSTSKSYKELGNRGFKKLARFIFGENESKLQIAMTSPVHMRINDEVSAMSFVMPSQYNKNNIPRPLNREVVISNSLDEYVAAVQFGGFATDKEIILITKKLENALKANSLNWYGNFRFLGYNSPYQLFGRKNEVIVSVKWQSNQERN